MDPKTPTKHKTSPITITHKFNPNTIRIQKRHSRPANPPNDRRLKFQKASKYLHPWTLRRTQPGTYPFRRSVYGRIKAPVDGLVCSTRGSRAFRVYICTCNTRVLVSISGLLSAGGEIFPLFSPFEWRRCCVKERDSSSGGSRRGTH